MKKYSQYSIYDSLMTLMPGLKIRQTHNGVSSKAAETLYEIWKDQDLKIEANKYKRPVTVGKDKLDAAQNAGLIKTVGQNIEITDKGAGVIKIMVLGDDSSSFDRHASDPDYMTAVSKMSPVTANVQKIASAQQQWWGRFFE